MAALMVGDLVRLHPEALEDAPELANGDRVWVSARDADGRLWLDTGRGDDLIGPYADGELVDAGGDDDEDCEDLW